MLKEKKSPITKTIILTLVLPILVVSGFQLIQSSFSSDQTLGWALDRDIWYKDSDSPGGIPEFGQGGKQNCGAVAAANCLWYWDHHGFPSLVNHTNPNDHSEKWVDDSRKLIKDLTDLIYPQNQGGNRGLGMERGISEYIKDRGHHWKHCQTKGLKLKTYESQEAKYSFFKSELERCQDVIALFAFRVRNNQTGEEGFIKGLSHAMTAAGIDNATPPKKAIFSNGEDDDHNNQPNPVSSDYYDELEMKDPNTTGDKLRSTDPRLAPDLPEGYTSLYAEMRGMYTICPYEAHAPGRRMQGSYIPTDSGYFRYCYAVHNDIELADLSSIALVGLAIDTPFDITPGFITSPPGWEWVLWDPKETPTLSTPGPVTDSSAVYDWEPSWTGILWYTETDPILPGDSLTGFSFRAPDSYPPTPWACFRGFSSSDNDDAISDFGFTLGPSIGTIPSLTEWGLIIFGVVLLGFITWVFLRRRKAIVGVQ